ncbi:hypothetical protein [Salisediminibacterium beveridgei]|nr:hypothetical protein [Salisediminibacterium beveridgei]
MMEEVTKNGQTFAVHAENNDLIQTLTKEVEAKPEAERTYEDLMATRPALAERLTVGTGIEVPRHPIPRPSRLERLGCGRRESRAGGRISDYRGNLSSFLISLQ